MRWPMHVVVFFVVCIQLASIAPDPRRSVLLPQHHINECHTMSDCDLLEGLKRDELNKLAEDKKIAFERGDKRSVATMRTAVCAGLKARSGEVKSASKWVGPCGDVLAPLTVAELRTLAATHEVDVSGLRTKAELCAALRQKPTAAAALSVAGAAATERERTRQDVAEARSAASAVKRQLAQAHKDMDKLKEGVGELGRRLERIDTAYQQTLTASPAAVAAASRGAKSDLETAAKLGRASRGGQVETEESGYSAHAFAKDLVGRLPVVTECEDGPFNALHKLVPVAVDDYPMIMEPGRLTSRGVVAPHLRIIVPESEVVRVELTPEQASASGSWRRRHLGFGSGRVYTGTEKVFRGKGRYVTEEYPYVRVPLGKVPMRHRISAPDAFRLDVDDVDSRVVHVYPRAAEGLATALFDPSTNTIRRKLYDQARCYVGPRDEPMTDAMITAARMAFS